MKFTLSTNEPENRARANIHLALILIGISCGLALFYSQFPLNHDNSWFLIATRKFLDGSRLYVDVVELNPPLAFYLTVPALWGGDLIRVSDSAAYVTYILILGGFSTFWCRSIAYRTNLSTSEQWLIVVVVGVVTMVLPISDFGQREHLMLTLSFPYLLSISLRERHSELSKFEQVAIGLWAFPGLALKPHFFLAPLFMILMAMYRDRSIKPVFAISNLVILFGTLGYLVFVFEVHPEYPHQIVPLAQSVYGSYGASILTIMLQPSFFAFPAILFFVCVRRNSIDSVSCYFLMACIGFIFAYFIQFKGWNYHILPSSAYLLIAVGWLALQQIAVVRASVSIGILFLIAVMGTLGQQLLRGPYESTTTSAFGEFVTRDEMRILVLSSNVHAAFPFVNSVNGQWASRYPAQWLIPGSFSELAQRNCLRDELRCRELQRILELARVTTVDDFERYRPELVFIDRRRVKPYFRRLQFEYLPFLNEDMRFAEIWQQYRRVGETLDYEVWELRESDSEAPDGA